MTPRKRVHYTILCATRIHRDDGGSCSDACNVSAHTSMSMWKSSFSCMKHVWAPRVGNPIIRDLPRLRNTEAILRDSNFFGKTDLLRNLAWNYGVQSQDNSWCVPRSFKLIDYHASGQLASITEHSCVVVWRWMFNWCTLISCSLEILCMSETVMVVKDIYKYSVRSRKPN